MTVLPDTQLALRLGAVEMRGDPDPVLLPAAELAEGAQCSGGIGAQEAMRCPSRDGHCSLQSSRSLLGLLL